MRTQAQFLDEYAESHRHPTNQIVHMICVPLIFIATLGLLWLVPVGRWLGLPAAWSGWVNVTTLATPLVILFYASLSRWSLLTGLAWLVVSYAVILGLQAAGLPLLGLFATVWVLAWIGQFWGHKVEGAKPSFADDLVFLLIGPLFVQKKFERGL